MNTHPAADIFPMLSDSDLDDLAADIRENGQREPIWLHRDGRIIDGRNRFRACEKAGVDPTFRTYDGADSTVLPFVVSLNLKRRHLSESQRAMVAARLANMGVGRPIQNPSIEGVSQADAASLLNVGRASVERAREVQEKAVPELVEAVDRGEVSVSAAAVLSREPVETQREVVELDDKEIVRRAREIRDRQRQERLTEKARKVAEIAANTPAPLVSFGPFPVLYVDPPWRYEHADETRKIENHYPTMSLDEIKALHVPACNDAVMFMWATSPKLRESFEVLEAWGFDYRTCMVWVKDKIGMGYYARQQHELLLIAKRGNYPVPDPEDRPSSVFEAPRLEHSAKPDLVYELIERMYPFAERCEMFQRRPRDGWAGWGNQAQESA